MGEGAGSSRFRVFGGLRVELAGVPLAGRAAQKKRLAALAILAASHPRGMTRELLATLLWPESSPEQGRGRVSSTLYELRRALGPVVVEAGEELRYRPEVLPADVVDFEQALATGDPAGAASAYDGPFLEGVFLKDAEELEQWIARRRDDYARRYAVALEAVAEEREAAGHAVESARAWQRLADHDPYNARIAARAIRALARAGDRAGAIRHGGAHTARLREDLEIEPDPEILALIDQLRDEPVEGTPALTVSALRARAPDADYLPSESSAAAGPSTPLRAGRRRLFAMTALTMALLATGIAGYSAWRSGDLAPARSLLATGFLPEQATLLMADFQSLSGDTVLAAVVTEALRVDLGRSPLVRLAQPALVRAALARMERDPGTALDGATAAELARREGLAGVVTGEVAGLGRGYVLTARVQAAADGAVLAAVRETAADADGVIPAIDRLSGQLRERIGESVRSLRAAPPLEQVTTGSLDALRRYSQAMGAEAAGDLERAIALLEEAVELDPGFAMAHRKLATLLLSWNRDRHRQIEALTRAYENVHRLTERERQHAAAAYHTTVSGDDRQAIRAYQTLTELDPRDLTAWNNLGFVHMRLGESAPAARAFERALEVDSMHVNALYNLVLARSDQGRVEEARTALLRFERRFGDRPGTFLLRYVLALFDDDLVAAEREAGDALERFGHDPTFAQWFGSARANILLLAGRLADAEIQLQALEARAREQGHGPAELNAAITRARVDIVFRGDTTRGLARLDGVLARFQEVPPLDRPYRALAAAAAQGRSPTRVRALIQDFDTALGAFPGAEPRRVRSYLDANLAMAEERLSDLEALLPPVASPRDCPHCVHAWLGAARDARGEHAAAAAHYRAYLGRRVGSQMMSHDPWWRVPVLSRMAELLEADGQRDLAAELSARAAELWRDADPGLAARTSGRGAHGGRDVGEPGGGERRQ